MKREMARVEVELRIAVAAQRAAEAERDEAMETLINVGAVASAPMTQLLRLGSGVQVGPGVIVIIIPVTHWHHDVICFHRISESAKLQPEHP